MMERDFMGLNSKESSLIAVKEEAVEATQDHPGIQWPLSGKIFALPHFMSFKVAQEDNTSKVVSDASRFMAMSSVDAFGVANIRQAGENQKSVNPVRQGGTHFSMPAYTVQQNAHSVHLPQDMKMLQSSNPFFKAQFTSGTQNFTGAPIKQQQLLGGIPVTAPHSTLLSMGSLAGTTETWSNFKPSQAPAQLTIFYGGTVNVYEDISPEKAQAIMLLAGNGILTTPINAQPRAQVQVPTSRLGAGDAIYVNQPMTAQPCSSLSSPVSVSSTPIGLSSGGPINTDESAKSSGVLANPIGKVDPPKVAASPLGSIAMSSMITSGTEVVLHLQPDKKQHINVIRSEHERKRMEEKLLPVPQARKASLARFLEKRKERCMSANPYCLVKDSAACTGNGSNGVSFSGSSGVSSDEHGVVAKG